MSKGGGSTTTQQLPAWLEDAAKSNLARANYASQLGYMPYYGNDVAAFSPMQNQAFQQTGMAAQAFGMAPQGFDPLAGMPQATTDAQGFSGYSSGNMFDNAMSQLQQRNPAQYNAYQSMFINPQTGAAPNVAFTPIGSIANPNAGAGTQAAAQYGSSTDASGMSGQQAYNMTQSLQNLADAPAWLSLLPFVGTAKGLATMYVNNEAQKMNEAGGSSTPYLYTDRGFTDDGKYYTTSWGETVPTAGMTDEQIAGLKIASNQNDVGSYQDDWASDAEILGDPNNPYNPNYVAPTGLLDAAQSELPNGITLGSDGKYIVPNGVGAYDTLDEAVTASRMGIGPALVNENWTNPVTPLPTPEWDYDPFADTQYFDNTVVPSIQQATPSGQIDPNYTVTPTGSTSTKNGTTATYTAPTTDSSGVTTGGGLTLSGKNSDGTYTVPDAYVDPTPYPELDLSSNDSSSKIVCTAMNERYGFGSFRNAIWLKYSADYLKPEHEIGYHAIFLPLVDYGFKQGDGITHRMVRKTLEHIAKHRTADLRAEMKGRKRNKLGMAYRFVLEPLCYLVGKVKGE